MKKLLLLVTPLLVSACSIQTYKPPQTLLVNAQQYDVSGANVKNMFGDNKIGFGGYRSVVKYGWVTSGSASVGVVAGTEDKQSFQFTHTIPSGDQANVRCSSVEHVLGLKMEGTFIGQIDSKNNGDLRCTVVRLNDKATWQVTVADPFGKTIGIDTKGSAIPTDGKTAIEMRQHDFGFVFSSNGQDVGALGMDLKTRVWLANGIDNDTALVVSAMMTAMIAKVDQ